MPNCQTQFLSALIAAQSPVSVYLKNGIKLRGTIVGHSETAIFLDDPIPQLVYKEQISTITAG